MKLGRGHWVGLASAATVMSATVVVATYAAASSPPPGAQPPTVVVAGKALPDQSQPHGGNGQVRPAFSPAPAHATASRGPHWGEILTASYVASAGVPLPFPGEMITLSTMYLDVFGNNSVGIYSGALGDDSTQGVIVVTDSPADISTAPFANSGTFTERGTGALTITRVDGAVVVLTDGNGRAHTFNLKTAAFS